MTTVHIKKPCKRIIKHVSSHDTYMFHMQPAHAVNKHAFSYAFPCYLNLISSKSNGYSMIPVVGTLTRSMSCSVGK